MNTTPQPPQTPEQAAVTTFSAVMALAGIIIAIVAAPFLLIPIVIGGILAAIAAIAAKVKK